ncbi:hypothetical protein ElyMa_003526500 [Elysia marginata]|uniref:Uncharacterized protein n=1 Tax=Elysia marginata TaxID=1093978 RepID=A0AAV4EHN5_9GAST|nr:hypothetical protein ElyMa_003526500 [Elysia marginata]
MTKRRPPVPVDLVGQKTVLMYTEPMGRVEGCRKRGRPAMSLMNSITTIVLMSLDKVVHRSREGESWRAVVASIREATIENSVADE